MTVTKKWFIDLFLLLLLLLSLFANWSCKEMMRDSLDFSYNNLKAVSLKELQRRYVENDSIEIERIKNFYGITQLVGFLWDKNNNDFIMIGKVDPEETCLTFDDFVISLRNLHCKYCRQDGNTMLYTNPSCTIDPDADTWSALDAINSSHEKQNGSQENEWCTLCSRPQKVGVFGIPFNTHLASTMVEADYLLKDITNGRQQVSVDGFKSLSRLRRELVDASIKKGNSNIQLGSPINRFEITGPKAYFNCSKTLYLINSLPIVLVTEEEFKSGNSFQGTGQSDPLANVYTELFNNYYQLISDEFPIYESLQKGFVIFAIAKTIYESEITESSSFFSVLLNDYQVDEILVPNSLPGKSFVDRIEYTTGDGIYTHTLFSCGGVNIDSKIRKSPIMKMKEREIIKSILMPRQDHIPVWDVKKVEADNIWPLYIQNIFMIL